MVVTVCWKDIKKKNPKFTLAQSPPPPSLSLSPSAHSVLPWRRGRAAEHESCPQRSRSLQAEDCCHGDSTSAAQHHLTQFLSIRSGDMISRQKLVSINQRQSKTRLESNLRMCGQIQRQRTLGCQYFLQIMLPWPKHMRHQTCLTRGMIMSKKWQV